MDTSTRSVKELCFGVNQVTKALEANSLRLVILCKQDTPIVLVQHVLSLCQLTGTKICVLEQPSRAAPIAPRLAAAFGLHSLLAMGCYKAADGQRFDHQIEWMLELSYAPPPPSWLPDQVAYVAPVTTTQTAKRPATLALQGMGVKKQKKMHAASQQQKKAAVAKS